MSPKNYLATGKIHHMPFISYDVPSVFFFWEKRLFEEPKSVEIEYHFQFINIVKMEIIIGELLLYKESKVC